MKSSRMKLLKKIYDYDQEIGGPISIPIDVHNIPPNDLSTLKNDVDYLEREGYIIQPINILSTYCLALTEKGEVFVENNFQVPLASSQAGSPIFNFNAPLGPNATFGTDIHQNITNNSTSDNHSSIDQSTTNNFGASISDIERLISAKSAADQEQLAGLVDLLRTTSEKDIPVQKGLLAKFSDGIKKHTDIITAIGNWAVKFLLSGQ